MAPSPERIRGLPRNLAALAAMTHYRAASPRGSDDHTGRRGISPRPMSCLGAARPPVRPWKRRPSGAVLRPPVTGEPSPERADELAPVMHCGGVPSDEAGCEQHVDPRG